MTDWTPEEDEAFNEVEKQSNLGKQILKAQGQPYHYAPQRTWVGLTDEEIMQIMEIGLGVRDTIDTALEKLMEKNQ
jgi:hypothetical protein